MDKADLKKDMIFQGLDRNLELTKQTTDISVQAKKWCIAFHLLLLGYVVKQQPLCIKWFHYTIVVAGTLYFMFLDVIQHYYAELLGDTRFKLNAMLYTLASATDQEIDELKPLPTTLITQWNTRQKFCKFFKVMKHKTIIIFYFGILSISVAIITGVEGIW